MKRIASVTLVAILGLSFVLAAASPLTPSRAARTWTVELYGDDMNNVYQYIPQNITINVGDAINFTDVSGQHSATAESGQAEWWDSGILNPGQSYLVTFNVSGIFTYWSTFPWDQGMVGTVTVTQPVPEYPGSVVFFVMAISAFAALIVERLVGKR